ncbi:hypothetical protein ABPG77_011012 [Micractinium sp. CCAP 211/92]
MDDLLRIDDRTITDLEEIDVDVCSTADSKVPLHRLCELIGGAAVAARASLRSLRLSGPLHLGVIFQMLAPWASCFTQLEAVVLSRGAADWQPAVAAGVLRELPALRRLQIRFSFDGEEPPEGLLSLLLPSGPAAAPGAAMDARLGMPQLQHLALIFPPRSVLPPTAPPPDALSTLTQLTALKLMRYPATSVPSLASLTNLRHLLWDPALPADEPYETPAGMERLTQLECLWLVTKLPLQLPASLAANLQGLHVMIRGQREDGLQQQRWDWLVPFAQLSSLRLQSCALRELPPEVASMSQLTRLDLMVNHLEELPSGPYLRRLQYIHLGNNRFSRFPSALLEAKHLVAAYLANQSCSSTSGTSSPGSSGGGSGATSATMRFGTGFTRRMELHESDVKRLLRLRHLQTLVMGNLQPEVILQGPARQDFSWLQRYLRQGSGARLTSNELAYPLHSKEVFEIPPLLPGSGSSSSGGSSDG